MAAELARLLTPAPEAPFPEPPAAARRRRVVVAVTLVVGTGLLAATLAVPAGSGRFTALGLAVAAAWAAGSRLSGPIPWRGRVPAGTAGHAALAPVVLGVLAYLAFLVASLLARQVPGLAGALDSILDRADAGPLLVLLVVALANGAAEEAFFRGALPAALGGPHGPRHATVVYVLVTAATLNLALVVAAIAMGTLLALERRATGGVLAPTVTHLTWSALMLVGLPR